MNVNKQLKKIEKQQFESHEERLARCVPLAKKVLNLLGTESIEMGDINDKNGVIKPEVKVCYINLSNKVLEEMKNANMLYADREFIFSLVLQGMEQVKERTIDSLSMSYDAIQENFFGKDFMDVTMEDMHAKLMESLKKK